MFKTAELEETRQRSVIRLTYSKKLERWSWSVKTDELHAHGHCWTRAEASQRIRQVLIILTDDPIQ